MFASQAKIQGSAPGPPATPRRIRASAPFHPATLASIYSHSPFAVSDGFSSSTRMSTRAAHTTSTYVQLPNMITYLNLAAGESTKPSLYSSSHMPGKTIILLLQKKEEEIRDN